MRVPQAVLRAVSAACCACADVMVLAAPVAVLLSWPRLMPSPPAMWFALPMSAPKPWLASQSRRGSANRKTSAPLRAAQPRSCTAAVRPAT